MDDLLFEILKLVVTIAVIVFARYALPAIKSLTSSTCIATAEKVVSDAVLYAQQVMKDSTGEEKKTVVTEIVEKILTDINVSMSDEQVDVLIEAAVKTMKMTEKEGSNE